VGPPTTTVTVSGTSFGANVLVDIYFDTTDLCLAIASGAGNISCTIKIPKDAQPQTHWISAVQRSTSTGAQKSFVVRTDWTQFHGMNAKHTGFNPFENTINAANVRNLDILWQAPIGPSGSHGTPAVVGSKVYVGSLDSKLYAFWSKTGAVVGGFPKVLGGPVSRSSPAVGSNIVYIGTTAPDNKLYAFKATTGAAIAGFPIALGGPIQASPTLYGSNVYVACTDGKIYAFNAATGATVPGFPITVGASLVATVSAANGRIYVGSSLDWKFYAFDAATGAAVAGYPISTGNFIESTAAIVSGQIFFAGGDGKLHGLHRDGTDLSGFPTSADVYSLYGSPAVGDGRVIYGNSKVYSYDPTNGALQWSKTLDINFGASPIIANGLVYVDTFSSLYALSEANGVSLWRASVSTDLPASPVVADGIVFIASTDGNLYAFSEGGKVPSSRLSGGELGIKPALTSLRPDSQLKASRS
jgi:outer membrane protein assembly factor BamB